ncbi:tRNA lysidine(34) synthetase TilS [Siphonobacter sp. SORGH_AS_1065]|uniref:tRNA lysidine(34) synthetase TilS n=1 Tax=Siphonobacter sp. SORGH_AS_1065 TaxID=3041795 RepID=UPI00278451CB|nr:tRNA lysidine(34) synthetase TilS [Siphonobacter sp. SORGH_AS_1065]MDQ1086817.1 tRNA(Ile)-lysidine synthase [Siphonobacter sp. SORGH_AS_1065]
MLTDFLAFINERKLFSSTHRLLVAVSGGLDSVVLTKLLQQAGFSFAIAHVNFQLRGQESFRDELFVQTLAESYQVPLYIERFDTKTIALQSGLSTQLTARNLRYDWFEKIRVKEHFDWILTAHHLNDSLETLLMNLTRGTGLSGIRGIPEKNGFITRPLLGFNRTQLHQYAQEQGLSWVEDSSNEKDDYQRNQLRHHVVPLLEKLNPSLTQTLRHTLDRLQAAERFIDQQLGVFKQKVTQNSVIPFTVLEAFPEPLLVLSETLKAYHFTYQQSKAIYENRFAQPGKRYSSPSHLLVLDRQQWILQSNSDRALHSYEISTVPFSMNTPFFSLTLQWVENFSFSSDAHVVFLDASLLDFPLQLRLWESGDWFCPLGMKGKKQKISDFLINQKVSVLEKESLYLLESKGNIVWVTGKRLDDRYKITENTTQILRVELRPISSIH